MFSFVKCGLPFLVFSVFFLRCSFSYHQCRINPMYVNRDANVTFSVIISLSEADDNGRCQQDTYSEEALHALTAIEWVVGKMNGVDGSEPFIPDVTFGFDIFDDCGDEENALRSVMEIKDPTFAPLLTTCETNEPQRIHIGILGPSRSPTTVKVAEHLRGTKIPAVVASATLPSLSDKSLYPNVVRTAVSDVHEVDAMVQLLKQLKWNYVTGVHSSDSYGKSGMQLLITRAREQGICIDPILEATGTNTDRDIGSKLISQSQKTTDKILGVVYFGQKMEISNLLFWMGDIPDHENIHWILSDSFGKMLDDRKSAAQGAIAIAPSHFPLSSFLTYVDEKWANAQKDVSKNQISSAIHTYISKTSNTKPGTMSDHLSAYMDAVYVLATSFKDARNALCDKGNDQICVKLRDMEYSGFLEYVKNVQVDYGNSSHTFFPEEFTQSNRTLSFNADGDIVKSSTDRFYDVKYFQNSQFNEVGYYLKDTLVIDINKMTDLNGAPLSRSSCYGVCAACINEPEVPYIVIPGDTYIFGLFSLHELNSIDLFKCGAFRNVSTDTITVEALLHSIEKLHAMTGIKFGAIAVDDCYSGLRANHIVTNFFSGSLKFKLPNSETTVDPKKVVAVIGGMSSGVTIPVAESFTRLRIPQVSYAASSPDLDDRISYPYFARTVPSDIYQAHAMVEIIKAFGWEYVSIVYVANNYGAEGKKAFLDIAEKQGVCVAEPVELSETGSELFTIELDSVIRKLEEQGARIVVYFGTDLRIQELSVRLKEKYDLTTPEFIFIGSEDWGTNDVILNTGGSAIRGSLTITLDTSKAADNDFPDYLVSKTPENYKLNPWFAGFWQAFFKCDPKNSFSNVFYKECVDNLKLTNEQALNFLNEQRVIQTMNAAFAVGVGIQHAKNEYCKFEPELPCNNFKLYPEKLVQSILDVQLSENKVPFKVFKEDGNGNIGFKIWNIRQNTGKDFEYKEVGVFADGALHIDKEKVFFYDQFGKQTIKTSLCTDTLCGHCKKITTKAPEATTSAPNPSDSLRSVIDDFRWSDAVIIIVLILLVIVIMAFVVYCCCCRKKEDDIYSSVQFQNNKYANGHIPTSDENRRIQMLNADSSSTILDRDINGNRGKVNEGFDEYIHAVRENYDLPNTPYNSNGNSPSRRPEPGQAANTVAYADLSDTYKEDTEAKQLPQYNQSTPIRQPSSSMSPIRTDMISSEFPNANAGIPSSQFPTQMYTPMNQGQIPAGYDPQQQPVVYAGSPIQSGRPFSETVLYDHSGQPFIIRPNSFPVQGQIQPVRVVSPVGSGQLNTSIESLPSYSQSMLQFSSNSPDAQNLQPPPGQHTQVNEASSDSLNSLASQSPRIRMGVNGSQLASQRQSPQTTQAIPMENMRNPGTDKLNISPNVNNIQESPSRRTENKIINNSQGTTSSRDNSDSPRGANKALENRQMSTSASNSDNNESLPTSPAHPQSRPGRPNRPRKPKPPLRTFSNKSDRDVRVKRSSSLPRELENSDDDKVSRV